MLSYILGIILELDIYMPHGSSRYWPPREYSPRAGSCARVWSRARTRRPLPNRWHAWTYVVHLEMKARFVLVHAMDLDPIHRRGAGAAEIDRCTHGDQRALQYKQVDSRGERWMHRSRRQRSEVVRVRPLPFIRGAVQCSGI